MREQSNNQLPEKRHSKLGIAAVVIGLTLPVLLVSLIIVFVYVVKSDISPSGDAEISLIVAGIFFPVIHLIAFVFSLIGLFSKKTKKLFPIIGAVLNLILMVIGIAMVVTGFSLLALLLSIGPVPVR